MSYQTVPLRVIGGTSENKSPQANSELTKNWYPEITEGGRNKAILLPWPGTTAYGTSPNATDRGLHVFKDVLYQVSGTQLYSIDENGTYSSIGTISGLSRCIFSDNGFQMVISADNSTYAYDGATLTKGGAEFVSTNASTMLNNQFIYDSTDDQFFVSDAGDALTINGLNFASAESAGDVLIRPYAYNQWVYMMGAATIEPWWNAGAGNPPFDRISGAISQKGLASRYAVAQTDQFLYFLGDDGNVYQMIQSSIRSVSTPSVAYQMGKLDIANSVAYALVLDGQDFIVFNFESVNLSYAYSEQTGEWFNLSTGVYGNRYIGSSYARVYGKHILADYRTGNTVELSDTAYTDIGETIQRRRITPPINSSQLGLGAGKRLIMSKAKFMLQTGQGLATGQGSQPAIMIECSTDGGATWGTESWPKVGKLGQFSVNVEFWKMKSFYDIQFRVTMSDPVFSSLHDGSIDIKMGGY